MSSISNKSIQARCVYHESSFFRRRCRWKVCCLFLADFGGDRQLGLCNVNWYLYGTCVGCQSWSASPMPATVAKQFQHWLWIYRYYFNNIYSILFILTILLFLTHSFFKMFKQCIIVNLFFKKLIVAVKRHRTAMTMAL